MSMRNEEDTQEAKDGVVFSIKVSIHCLRSLSSLKNSINPFHPEELGHVYVTFFFFKHSCTHR